jgi:phage terminase large subunit
MSDGTFRKINRSFIEHVESNQDARTYIFYGGAGSGKSVFVMQWLLREAITRSINVLILRQWREVVRESVIVPFRVVSEDFGISWENAYHKSERTLTINKSRIVFGGLDNVEKYKGTNWNFIWIEEATDISASDFDLLNLRLGRDAEDAKFVLTFNPIDENHWLIQRFVRKMHPGTAVHHSTYLDNYAFLSQQFISQIENLINIDANFYRVYALGEPGILKDLIYNNWTEAPLPPESHTNWDCAGLDFGFNNPSALVYIQKMDAGIHIDERFYNPGYTNSDIIAWLKDHHDPRIIIYADSAEPQRIEEIQRAGFVIQPANKSVKDGIDFCKAQRLLISPDSRNLIKEIRGYKWRELKDGSVLDEPVKANDHLTDAFRYAIYTHFGMGDSVIIPKNWIGFDAADTEEESIW